ncbi:MAG TPA: hypothetical protein VF265_09495 [Nevskiaceae bacterium]
MWLTQFLFDVALGSVYRRVVTAAGTLAMEGGTLIASNHQREVDGPLMGSVLVARHGMRFAHPLPYFAARDDLFRPGILSRLEVHWPRAIDALLSRVSLAWFFPLGRTEPMLRVREFTLRDTLQALIAVGMGATACGALLNARGLRALGGLDSALSIRALMRYRDIPFEGWWGLRRLTLATFNRLAPLFRNAVEGQLQLFAQRLNNGHSVYFAPEGSISYDGRFGRIRAGSFRLVHMARTPPWIQPAGFGYDVFVPGRSRFVVRLGERFRADRRLSRRDFDAQLRERILALAPITPSHLLACFLSHGPRRFSERDLCHWLSAAVAELEAQRRSLDPAFATLEIEALTTERLHWLQHKGLVRRQGIGFANLADRDSAPGWRNPSAVVRYLDNSLLDIAPLVVRTLKR